MSDFSRHSDTGLISADNLHTLMNGPDAGRVKILDATFVLPGSPLHPAQGYVMQHIPGARYFDIEDIADHNDPLPHMLPPPAEFERHMTVMGIGSDDFIVVYDQSGLYMASARAWWMLRAFGHDNVCVLDGGLPAWQAAGYPLSSGEEAAPAKKKFTATFRPSLVSNKEKLLATLNDNETLILDARPAERFAGHAPEPRQGMRAGHIPGSRNLPFGSLIEPRTRALHDPATLAALFDAHGADKAARIATTCGSGVTACIIALGLFRTGRKDVSVHDGSWSEWGALDSGTPIEILHS